MKTKRTIDDTLDAQRHRSDPAPPTDSKTAKGWVRKLFDWIGRGTVQAQKQNGNCLS